MPTPTWPPGISRESVRAPNPVRFRTGVPVFVGYAERVTPTRAAPGTSEAEAPEMRGWADFQETFGTAVTPGPVEDAGNGFLAPAVRGFFRNGGQVCRVVALRRPDDDAPHAARHVAALESVDRLEDVDLLCLPDLLLPLAELGLEAQRTGAKPDAGPVAAARKDAAALHGEVLRYCGRRGDLFAVLDAPPGTGSAEVNAYADDLARVQGATDAALYYPWLLVPAEQGGYGGPCPPCGHVAGVYAAGDRAVGVHKAPANVALDGVVDLERPMSQTEHGGVHPQVNCLRAFPGRGVRVWGARTLAGAEAGPWTYVPVRRLFQTVARWIGQFMSSAAFEPNGQPLWSRITRETTSYLNDLYRRGALLGATPQQAFYVRCDSALNPPEQMELGEVVTEIGLAAGAPNEFIAVRVTHAAGGVTITGPNPA